MATRIDETNPALPFELPARSELVDADMGMNEKGELGSLGNLLDRVVRGEWNGDLIADAVHVQKELARRPGERRSLQEADHAPVPDDPGAEIPKVSRTRVP